MSATISQYGTVIRAIPLHLRIRAKPHSIPFEGRRYDRTRYQLLIPGFSGYLDQVEAVLVRLVDCFRKIDCTVDSIPASLKSAVTLQMLLVKLGESTTGFPQELIEMSMDQ